MTLDTHVPPDETPLDAGGSLRDFTILWAGNLVSTIGTGMSAFAVGVELFQRTGEAASVAAIALAAFAPIVLLNPLGGVLADRHDRRLLMIVGDAGSAVGLLLLLAASTTDRLTVTAAVLGIAMSSIPFALVEPAYKASVTDMVTPEEYARVSGLVQLASASRYLVAPVLAGLVLAAGSLSTVLELDLLTVIITVATTSVVRTRHEAQGPQTEEVATLREDFAQGWTTVRSADGVGALIGLLSLVTFAVGFLQTLYKPLVLPIADERVLGILESVSAAGLLVTSAVIGAIGIRSGFRTMLIGGLGAAGLAMALLGAVQPVVLIGAAGVLFFAALPFVNTACDVMIRSAIPNDHQGRTWGLVSVLSQLGMLVAFGISGVLADNVFAPLLTTDGPLADSVGQVLGTGPSRGIGLLVVLSGLGVLVLAAAVPRLPSLERLARAAVFAARSNKETEDV